MSSEADFKEWAIICEAKAADFANRWINERTATAKRLREILKSRTVRAEITAYIEELENQG